MVVANRFLSEYQRGKGEIIRILKSQGIEHKVLNANTTLEAAIVAQAGRLGAVTVATNMAGRGTDIILGGNAEYWGQWLEGKRSP